MKRHQKLAMYILESSRFKRILTQIKEKPENCFGQYEKRIMYIFDSHTVMIILKWKRFLTRNIDSILFHYLCCLIYSILYECNLFYFEKN